MIDQAINAGTDTLTEAALLQAGLETRTEADAVIAAALALAHNWAADTISLDDVRRQSTPQERFLLARFGPRPMPAPVRALFDALVDSDPTSPQGYGYRTAFGLMTSAELSGPLVKQDRLDDGRIRTRFASFWPWLRKPDKDATTVEDQAGERREPVFAESKTERDRFAPALTYGEVMGRQQPRRIHHGWDETGEKE